MSDTAILILRLVVGLYVAGHGAQKLFGWFGGSGMRATIDLMGGRLGLRPAPLWVTVLSASEFVGGLLMAVGLLGSLGPLAVAGSMLGASVFGHWSNGPWGAKGGYELSATNMAVALAVALLGVGSLSVDAWFGLSMPQTAALIFAALVALGVFAAGISRASQPESQIADS